MTFTATVAPQPPSGGTPAGGVQFAVDGTNVGSPVTLDGGGKAAMTTSSLTPGSHTLKATYLGGTSYSGSSASITQKVTTRTPPPTPRPPTISGAHLTHKRFRVGPRPTAISASSPKAPVGTAFVFTLSRPGDVQIKIKRSVPGRRSGRRCVAPTRRLNRAHAQRCIRTITVGTLKRGNQAAGIHRLSFSGRLGRRPLPPGHYQAVLQARNVAGGSNLITLPFAIVA